MNKRLLLTFYFFVIAVIGFSQNTTSIAAGININDTRFGDTPAGYGRAKVGSNIGLHAGIFRSLHLDEKMEFTFGLQYSQKGSKGIGLEHEVLLKYLELPCFFSWRPAPRLSVDAGPSIAYNLIAHAKFYDRKNRIDIKKTDVLLNAGASFIVFKNISIYARYCYGLIPYSHINFRDEQNVLYHKTPSYNTTIQFGVRYVVSRQN